MPVLDWWQQPGQKEAYPRLQQWLSTSLPRQQPMPIVRGYLAMEDELYYRTRANLTAATTEELVCMKYCIMSGLFDEYIELEDYKGVAKDVEVAEDDDKDEWMNTRSPHIAYACLLKQYGGSSDFQRPSIHLSGAARDSAVHTVHPCIAPHIDPSPCTTHTYNRIIAQARDGHLCRSATRCCASVCNLKQSWLRSQEKLLRIVCKSKRWHPLNISH